MYTKNDLILQVFVCRLLQIFSDSMLYVNLFVHKFLDQLRQFMKPRKYINEMNGQRRQVIKLNTKCGKAFFPPYQRKHEEEKKIIVFLY